MDDHAESINNNSKRMRETAREALKAAKLVEAQRVAGGAKWVKSEGRSWRLKRE